MDWFSKCTEPQTPKLTTVTFDADSDNGKADAQMKWAPHAANADSYSILIQRKNYVGERFLTACHAQVHILTVYFQNIWLFYSYYFKIVLEECKSICVKYKKDFHSLKIFGSVKKVKYNMQI